MVQDLYYKNLLKNKMVNERIAFIEDYIKMRASVRFLIKIIKCLKKKGKILILIQQNFSFNENLIKNCYAVDS